jgi:L-rhamnose-H+ transport protein
MPESFWLATLAVLIGGLMQGSYLLPIRLAQRWAWENLWLVYSMVGLVFIPWIVAQLTIPHLVLVYYAVPTKILVATALFGFGWGVANVLFGSAVRIVGMALSFAVVVGMSSALGCLIPLLLSSPARLLQSSGLMILAGVVLTSLGIILMGLANRARERAAATRLESETQATTGMTVGLVLCVIAGFLSPMLNYSFAFGSPIREQAIHYGATVRQAANAIWAIALAGGFVANAGYSALLLSKSRTWSKFVCRRVASQYALSALMGVLFMGGLLLYGWGATGLGNLGAAIGWPIFQTSMIVLSATLGIVMGEWRNVAPRVFRTNIFGLGILLAAIVVLSIGNRM